jgi:hypothetical protein
MRWSGAHGPIHIPDDSDRKGWERGFGFAMGVNLAFVDAVVFACTFPHPFSCWFLSSSSFAFAFMGYSDLRRGQEISRP